MNFTRTTLRLSASAAAIAAALLAGQATAATVGTLDIGGVAVDGGSTTTLLLAGVAAGTLTDIEFDFSVEHFPISWGSETRIEIVAPDSTAFNFTGGDFGFPSSPGVYSFSGSIAAGPVSTLGTWTFNFTDSFDDFANPDHVYYDGSSISLNAAPIPLPAGMMLGLSGLAALGAVGIRRRRKSDPA